METPNAGDGSTLQANVIAASAMMLALSTIAVGLRVYTRQALLGIMGADDGTILAALVCGVQYSHFPTFPAVVKTQARAYIDRNLDLVDWSYGGPG